jgi:deoxyribose-phosphate aldolase
VPVTDLAAVARRALPLIDLTSLNDDDTPERIAALCGRAVTPFGKVAAVCIYPRFVAQARELLRGKKVRIATVSNFPQGTAALADVVSETRKAVADGADEVDVVMPYRAYLAGDRRAATELIAATKAACGDARLKVILETGQLARPEVIAGAGRDAIAAGADFLKTSTGKTSPSATPEAAEALLEVIRAHRDKTQRVIGFKAAGGIRTAAQAAVYLDLADRLLGPDYARPETLRFGASGLLDDLLAVLGETATAGKAAKSDY